MKEKSFNEQGRFYFLQSTFSELYIMSLGFGVKTKISQALNPDSNFCIAIYFYAFARNRQIFHNTVGNTTVF